MFNNQEDRLATPSEAYREMVRNMGEDRQQDEWLLTDFDTWERNPHYTGPRGPHPEDEAICESMQSELENPKVRDCEQVQEAQAEVLGEMDSEMD